MKVWLQKFQAYQVQCVTFSLMIFSFALPLSSSGKSIFFVLSVLSILCVPEYRSLLLKAYRKEWAMTGVLFVFIAIIACSWSYANFHEKSFIVEKYSKIIYLPLLAVGFVNPRTRWWSLHAYIFSMLFVAVLASLKAHGYLVYLKVSYDHLFRNHIITGIMSAFAAYLCFWLASYPQRLANRLYYIAIGLILSYFLLFVNLGATGYAVYFLLMMLLVSQVLHWKQALLGMLIVCGLFLGAYTVSKSMHTKVNRVVEEAVTYRNNSSTSVGLRIRFHQFADTLFLSSPFIGHGTGGFTYHFRALNPVPEWGHRLWEPHGNYWLVAAEFGLLGLLTLLYFLGCLLKVAFTLKEMKMVGLGMLATFFVGNLSDSLFFYSGPGYLFILFMAMSLGESLECDIKTENHIADK